MRERTGGRDKDLGARGVISLPESQQFKKSESPGRPNKTHRPVASPASKLREFTGHTVSGKPYPNNKRMREVPCGKHFLIFDFHSV